MALSWAENESGGRRREKKNVQEEEGQHCTLVSDEDSLQLPLNIWLFVFPLQTKHIETL